MRDISVVLARSVASVSLLAGLAFQPASADLVLDLGTGGTATACFSCGNVSGNTVGWSFRVDSAVSIDGLGVWDAGADGTLALIALGLAGLGFSRRKQ